MGHCIPTISHYAILMSNDIDTFSLMVYNSNGKINVETPICKHCCVNEIEMENILCRGVPSTK